MTLFGWRDEIAIVVTVSGQGSSLAMRSASLVAGHDLGRNGKRIEKFLVNLDEAVSKYSIDNSAQEPAPVPAVHIGG